jgi:putative colanic acid biosynthesis acetyltransferase WcaF
VIEQNQDSATQPSFSLGNRIRRLIWQVAYQLFFRFTPRPLHTWRAYVLRLFGAKVGPGAHVYPRVRIWAPWNLEIGAYAGIADGVTLYSMARIRIGERAVVSQGAHLCTGSHDINSANFQLVVSPISIGERAWVCAEAFILPGIVVPDGVVIGARAVVTRSPDMAWSVYAGHPAKRIGARQRPA